MRGGGKDVFRVPCFVQTSEPLRAKVTEHGARSTLTFRNRQRDQRLNLPFLRRVLLHVLASCSRRGQEAELSDDHNASASSPRRLRTDVHDLCFHFVTAEAMARVNWQFLQHEGSTDVITFDHSQPMAPSPDPRRHPPSPLSGEAFICVADAVKQAREFKTSWQSEVIRYAVHAVLHLRGYDDLQPAKRRVMKREENRLMRELAAAFDLSQLGTQNPKP